MLYIIPFQAKSINDVIQVESELGVAEFFLTKDNTATATPKILWAILSDPILNFLCGIVKVRPRGMYLRHIYERLSEGMGSSFCWGDERFVTKYFA